MNIDLNTYRKFDTQIREVYESIPLNCISDRIFDEKQSLTFFTHSTNHKNPIKKYNQFQFHMELVSINEDIKFLTGLVHFFHPYINRELDTYFQTLEDKRYLLFSGLAHQTLYNYWDRIGDLLAIYFDTGLREREIYFLKVLDNFPNDYQKSQYFQELKKLSDENLKNLLDERRIIVHYLQLNAKFFTEFFINSDERESLMIEKENLPLYFKKHLDLSVKGFELTLKLINELPDKND